MSISLVASQLGEINTKITLSWALKRFVTRVHIHHSLFTLSSHYFWARSLEMNQRNHYSDVIMSTIVSQITGVSIVCSTVCSGADQRKHQSPASLAFVMGSTSDRLIPRTKGQWRESVSFWWRHHGTSLRPVESIQPNLQCKHCFRHRRYTSQDTPGIRCMRVVERGVSCIH